MTPWSLALVGAAVTAATVPAVRAVMTRAGVIDTPGHRSSHSTPVPRAGGLACVAGVVTSTVLASATGTDAAVAGTGVAVLVALVGLADDRLGLPPVPRLLGQLAAGAALGGLTGGAGWIAAGAVITAVTVNTVNFVDGINGITAMVMAVWGAATGLAGTAAGSTELMLLGLVTCGSALGFLPWNSPRARIFLGDVGSYFFGALAALGLLLAAGTRNGTAWPIVLAPLAVPLLDVATTLVRRAARGARLTQAHREHVYQRLAARLDAHLPVAVTVALLSTLLAVTATLVEPSVLAGVVIATAATYLLLPRIVRALPDRTRPRGRRR